MIDGALGALQVFTALRYYDTAKYMNEQPFVRLSASPPRASAGSTRCRPICRAWCSRPPDTAAEVNPREVDFLARRRKTWVEKGGELETLSPAHKAELLAKTGSIGQDIVKTKPELQPLWELQAAVKRT